MILAAFTRRVTPLWRAIHYVGEWEIATTGLAPTGYLRFQAARPTRIWARDTRPRSATAHKRETSRDWTLTNKHATWRPLAVRPGFPAAALVMSVGVATAGSVAPLGRFPSTSDGAFEGIEGGRVSLGPPVSKRHCRELQPHERFDNGGIMPKTMLEWPGGCPLAEDAFFRVPAVMHHAIDGQGWHGVSPRRQKAALLGRGNPRCLDGGVHADGTGPSVPPQPHPRSTKSVAPMNRGPTPKLEWVR